MFTFNRVVKDFTNEPARRREITVEFKNELNHTKEQMLSFNIQETDIAIKRAFQSFLSELNATPTPITDLTVPPDVVTPPTQAELEKQAWETDFAKLKKVQELITCGALLGNEAAVVALRNKVKADFKPAYL